MQTTATTATTAAKLDRAAAREWLTRGGRGLTCDYLTAALDELEAQDAKIRELTAAQRWEPSLIPPWVTP